MQTARTSLLQLTVVAGTAFLGWSLQRLVPNVRAHTACVAAGRPTALTGEFPHAVLSCAPPGPSAHRPSPRG